MAPRLKTYWAEIDGLHDWAVAAPNQHAALDALGVNQNLFAQHEAGVSDDAAAIEAASAHPGQAVRRRKGGAGAYELAQGGGGWESALAALPRTSKPKAPSRAALDKAEAELETVRSHRQAALLTLAKEEDALKARRIRLEREFAEREEKARARVEKEAERFNAAGGRR